MDDANTCKSHKRSLRCVCVAEEKTQLNMGTYYTVMLIQYPSHHRLVDLHSNQSWDTAVSIEKYEDTCNVLDQGEQIQHVPLSLLLQLVSWEAHPACVDLQ